MAKCPSVLLMEVVVVVILMVARKLLAERQNIVFLMEVAVHVSTRLAQKA